MSGKLGQGQHQLGSGFKEWAYDGPICHKSDGQKKSKTQANLPVISPVGRLAQLQEAMINHYVGRKQRRRVVMPSDSNLSPHPNHLGGV